MNFKFTHFCLLFGCLLLMNSHKSRNGKLVLNVNNIRTDQGIIWVGIYNSKENFLIKERAIIERYDVTRKSPNQSLVIHALPYGEYAIALFHDENGNGLLDKNFFGIPSEPYAFSRKPRTKWRLPKFEEIKFHFTSDQQVLTTKLEKW